MFEKPILFDNSQIQNTLKKYKCKVPFVEFHLYPDGKVSNCCFSWLPTHIGNINEKTLRQITEDELAVKIKNSINDGTYSYCNSQTCPFINELVTYDRLGSNEALANKFGTPDLKNILIFMDYDRTCNLYCESCRNERIIYTKNDAPEILRRTHENAIKQIDELISLGYKVTLNLCGSGDLFASALYMDYLQNMPADYPVKLHIITNGILLTQDRLNFPYARKITHISVSVDAASPETYKIVRRGGQFATLEKNMFLLDEMISKKQVGARGFELNFVVQKDNYHEIAAFSRWALQFKNVYRIWYNLIADWGHLDSRKFNDKAVWKSQHPLHKNFLSSLKDPILFNEKVFLGNLAPYVETAKTLNL